MTARPRGLARTDHYMMACPRGLARTDPLYDGVSRGLARTDHFSMACPLGLARTDHFMMVCPRGLARTDTFYDRVSHGLARTDPFSMVSRVACHARITLRWPSAWPGTHGRTSWQSPEWQVTHGRTSWRSPVWQGTHGRTSWRPLAWQGALRSPCDLGKHHQLRHQAKAGATGDIQPHEVTDTGEQRSSGEEERGQENAEDLERQSSHFYSLRQKTKTIRLASVAASTDMTQSPSLMFSRRSRNQFEHACGMTLQSASHGPDATESESEIAPFNALHPFGRGNRHQLGYVCVYRGMQSTLKQFLQHACLALPCPFSFSPSLYVCVAYIS